MDRIGTASPLRPRHLAGGERPVGRRFVTVRLIHPARNRLPRDFIG